MKHHSISQPMLTFLDANAKVFCDMKNPTANGRSSIISYSFAVLLLMQFLVSASQGQQEEKDLTKLTLSTGIIRGRKIVTTKNITAYLFHGVPYAEAPVGNLRYRAPTNKKSWEGEMNTQAYKFACLNAKVFDIFSGVKKSEDCLHANIFTTAKCISEKNCPVIYYIFGGKWISGSPFTFPDDLLVDNYQSKDIILVTVTFRLGSFGFFNTGTRTSAEKNLGLLDMIHGLHWVQQEIGAFGGDKNKVTLMGHSSGAAGVDLLALSPKTEGLFHQVIIMSGPAGMMNWRSDNNLRESRSFAVMAGCATEEQWDKGESFENMIDCLRNKSAEDLVAVQKEQEDNGKLFYGPAIDGADGALPEEIEALQRKRRPYHLLIGTTSRESRITKSLVDKQGVINRPLLNAACALLARSRDFKNSITVGNACADDYANRHIRYRTKTIAALDIADLTDDLMYYVTTYDSSEAMRLRGATVYKYSFEYDAIGAAFGEKFKEQFGIESPAHAQDLVYVMGLRYEGFTDKDEKIRQIYSGMFADFIKTGDPTPSFKEKWQPTDGRNNYFKIDFDDTMNMPGNTIDYHSSAVKFWTKTALDLEKLDNKNDTFDFDKLSPELIQGLKDIGNKLGGEQIKAEIEKWEYDKQQRHILPSVRDESAFISKNDRKLKLLFLMATAMCVLLLFALLATIRSRRFKQNVDERLCETSALHPTSMKTYGNSKMF